MIEIALSLLGLGRKFPLITGLLLFSLTGMGYSYYKGREHVNNLHRLEKAKAIEKDARENQELKDQAHKDQLEHQTTIAKSQSRLEKETDEIKNLKASECLDVKLVNIGLR